MCETPIRPRVMISLDTMVTGSFRTFATTAPGLGTILGGFLRRFTSRDASYLADAGYVPDKQNPL